MNPAKCPFCELGQAKRYLAWILTKDLSKSSLRELIAELKKNNPKPSRLPFWKSIPKSNPTSVCPICKKICGNPGMLAMHMKSPGRPYREIHRKFELEKQ